MTSTSGAAALAQAGPPTPGPVGGLDVPGGWRPTPDQEALLDAILAPPAETEAAYRRWRARVDLDEVDRGSFRILPALSRALARAGVEDEETDRLRGVYRQALYKNHLLADRALAAARALQAHGVEVTFLKGMPLAHLYYQDRGARAMSDVDLLVPPALAGHAAWVLQRHGWRPQVAAPRDVLGIHHSLGFHDRRELALDLHRATSLYGVWRPAAEARLVADRLPFRVGDVEAWTLGPTAMLFHVLVHGSGWNPVPPLRWVLDAHAVLRSDLGPIDWERLVQLALDLRVARHLLDPLEYLARRFGVEVPHPVLPRLRAARVPRWVAVHHRCLHQPWSRWTSAQRILSEWALARGAPRGAVATRSLPEYLRRRWGRASWSEVLGLVWRQWTDYRPMQAWMRPQEDGADAR